MATIVTADHSALFYRENAIPAPKKQCESTIALPPGLLMPKWPKLMPLRLNSRFGRA
ncbi:MAG: hypothetical protein NTW56_09710 [Alphaproteobacteria bacterium]|nr:hypothetical protein [Alphaproteobacteria bacterium]